MHPITEAALLLSLSGALVDRFERSRGEHGPRMTLFDKLWFPLIAAAAQLLSVVLIGRWLGSVASTWLPRIFS